MVVRGTQGRSQAERSAESSRRLLDAAIALFAEKGFERTTAAEIGERAGYSREMVRSRYGSKEGLLESLLRNEYEPMFLSRLDVGGDALSRLLDQWDHLAAEAEAKPDLLRVLFMVCFGTVGPIEQLAPWVRGWMTHQRQAVAASLSQGQVDGSVRTDLDPVEEADRMLTYGLGLGFRWTLDPDALDLAAELRAWGERLAGDLSPPG